MTLPLQGRRILVTEGATGIGAAAVHVLSEAGAAVVATYHQTPPADRAGVTWVQCDVRDSAAVDGMVSGAAETLGGLDVLLHAAGLRPADRLCRRRQRVRAGPNRDVRTGRFRYQIQGRSRSGAHCQRLALRLERICPDQRFEPCTPGRAPARGRVCVGQHVQRISPQGPYGGYKQSGFGRTGGLEGLHEFQQVKNIRIGMR